MDGGVAEYGFLEALEGDPVAGQGGPKLLDASGVPDLLLEESLGFLDESRIMVFQAFLVKELDLYQAVEDFRALDGGLLAEVVFPGQGGFQCAVEVGGVDGASVDQGDGLFAGSKRRLLAPGAGCRQ